MAVVSKAMQEHVSSLPKQMQVKLQEYFDAHSTLEVSTKATVILCWAEMNGMPDKQYWELTYLTKSL